MIYQNLPSPSNATPAVGASASARSAGGHGKAGGSPSLRPGLHTQLADHESKSYFWLKQCRPEPSKSFVNVLLFPCLYPVQNYELLV